MRCSRRWEWSRGCPDSVRHGDQHSRAWTTRRLVSAPQWHSPNQTRVGGFTLLRCTKQPVARLFSAVFELIFFKLLLFGAKCGTSTVSVDNSVDEPKPCSIAQAFVTIPLDWRNFDRPNLVRDSSTYGTLPSTESFRSWNRVAAGCQASAVHKWPAKRVLSMSDGPSRGIGVRSSLLPFLS
jgi:hypothetical protein